jgi:ferredoxin
LAAPTIFEVGEDGRTHLLREPSDTDLSAVREAIENCPASALSLVPNG